MKLEAEKIVSRIGTFVLTIFVLHGCASPGPELTDQASKALLSEDQRLHQWFEQKYEEELQFSPMLMTYLGRPDKKDQVDDFSREAAKEQLEWRAQTIAEMEEQFDYAELSPQSQLSYDLWKYQYKEESAAQKYFDHEYIFEQMGGAQSFLPNFLLNFHGVENQADMEAYIKRIGGMSRAINQLLQRAKTSAEKGIRPPYFAYEGALEQSQKLMAGLPFDAEAENDSALWADVKAKLVALESKAKIDSDTAAELSATAKTALEEQFGPAYGELMAWLKKDMSNVSEQAKGVASLPDGKAYYSHRLWLNTTTDLSAEQVHEIGKKEVARLRKAIEDIMAEVNFEGSLAEFFEFFREDKQFYYANDDAGRQAYIDTATEHIDAIKSQLPDYFGLLPKADLIVKRVEPFREQDGAAQHYFAGTPDGSRPGIYYAHLSDMGAMPIHSLEVIAYHEGLPGHHMQISIAQELQGVPTFRTQVDFTAYIEGWALYSEQLAGEMGAYEDPYSLVGRLASEMWRAIRLVVDTGIHVMGWTEEQAVEYFMANSPEPEASVRSEIQRYFVMPGQATSYKIGMIKILELREKAKNSLGDKFDIRGFHDAVLGGGALPLNLLELRVQRWMDSVNDGTG